MRSALAVIAAALWITLCPRLADAHQASITYVSIEAAGRVARVEVRIASLDLNEAVGAGASVEFTRDGALAAAPAAADYIRARLSLRDGAARCVAAEHSASVREQSDGFELLLRLPYACPRTIDSLSVRYDLFFDVDARHQGMCTMRGFGRDFTRVFVARDRTASLSTGRTLWMQLAEYATLGIEHIFIGYDHIAFLCGLLLLVGRRPPRQGARELAWIVTSFTLAHSITLIGAALRWFAISSSVVEPAIALSIAFVAVENLARTEPKHRRALTFGFGLVHGFGFASVLAEQGLPARALIPSLLAFNGGVELGQLALVCLAMPVLTLFARERWSPAPVALAAAALALTFALLSHAGVERMTLGIVLLGAVPLLGLASRRWGYERGVLRVGSVALGVLGLFWFAERVLSFSAFGGALG